MTISIASDVLNVAQRLDEQTAWVAEWQLEQDALEQLFQELDLNDPKNGSRGMQIGQEMDAIRWKRTKEPIFIDLNTLEQMTLEIYRNQLGIQFALLSDDQKHLWLDNLQFIKTPDIQRLETKINE